MTGGKRKMSTGPEWPSPPHKAARPDDDDDGDGNNKEPGPSSSSLRPSSMQPPSSQPISSQIEPQPPDVPTITYHSSPEPIYSQLESSQVVMSNVSHLAPPSSQLESSQLGSSIMTDRSLSDVSETEKMRWRDFVDPKEFFEFTSWNKGFLGVFVEDFRSYSNMEGISFHDWLILRAQENMYSIYYALESKELNTQIDWKKIPYIPRSTTTKKPTDDLIYVWIQLKKYQYHLSVHGAENEYANLLAAIIPTTRREKRETQQKEVAKAFHRQEKFTETGRVPSEAVYQKIVEYYNNYHHQTHLSPYTSIVGPSGIGKSFSVQQVAVTHGIYVLYATFARQGSTSYPRRSAIADWLPRSSIRQELVEFWEAYVLTGLINVEVCREIGITPAGFYNLQTKEPYRAFQQELVDEVKEFLEGRKSEHKRGRTRMRDLLQGNAEHCRASLAKWREDLDYNGDNFSRVQRPALVQDIPKALIAMDEASELARDEEALLFRSFREALRNRFRGFDNKSVDLSKPQGDFFSVLLDTNSRVGDFSPSVVFDKSQREASRMGIGQRLFAPIYAINTIDIFRDNDGPCTQDGSAEAVLKLFRLGRPLWGSRYDVEGELSLDHTNTELMNLAWEKTEGQGKYFDLALLAYRLNFCVTNDTLETELVSKYLRFIIYINEARNQLITKHPSEPILAFVATEKMKYPSRRLNVISQFASSCFDGSLNAGDIGEMVASLVLLFAYDEAHHLLARRSFPTAMPVSNFMESLFGHQAHSNMAECMVSDSDMERLWAKGQVFFNHVVKAETVPDEKKLHLGFERGVAYFLPQMFEGADILIPIQVADSEMSFCLIQVKNRKHDKPTSGLRSKAVSSLSKAVEALKLQTNHIGIMMCLRHRSTATRDNDDGLQIVLPRVYTPRTTRKGATKYPPASTSNPPYSWPKKGKRMVALAVGLDNKTYPSIDKCKGQRTEETTRILPQLQRLLDCAPGTTLPAMGEAEADYVRRANTVAV